MKANELMIGDWVVINENHPDCPFTRRLDIGDLSFFTKFAPIPLTAEILEKNGWKEYPQVYCNQKALYFDIYRFEDEVGIKIQGNCIVLHYVHELQHALRLCGLNDLADNFKI